MTTKEYTLNGETVDMFDIIMKKQFLREEIDEIEEMNINDEFSFCVSGSTILRLK